MRFYCANFDEEQWTRTKHLTNFQNPPPQNTTMRIDFFGRFSPRLVSQGAVFGMSFARDLQSFFVGISTSFSKHSRRVSFWWR